MPFKSKAQMGAAFGGHLGPEMKKKAKSWAHKTPNIEDLPQHVKKEDMNEIRLSKIPNNIEFFVVEKPMSPSENPQMLVHKSDPFTFARQVIGGLREDQVYGFFLDEEEADNAAHDLVDAVYESAKNLEMKKETVLEKLNKHINRLQKEINGHMKSASDLPEEADKHHMMAERKMQMIKAMREKHKMVEAAKKELPELKQDKKRSLKESDSKVNVQNKPIAYSINALADGKTIVTKGDEIESLRIVTVGKDEDGEINKISQKELQNIESEIDKGAVGDQEKDSAKINLKKIKDKRFGYEHVNGTFMLWMLD